MDVNDPGPPNPIKMTILFVLLWELSINIVLDTVN